MPPYHPGWKFNYDDDIAIVSKAASKIINFVLQDMGAGNISQKMLKNPPIYGKTKNSVQKRPPVKDTKRKIIQKNSQVVAPSKQGQKANSKPTNAPLRK
jgi:hypothetical protein